jgi:CubicO group peptidase (beta-lactamase class C family)
MSVRFSLGFMKSTPALPFGSAKSFGSPGAGGALGFADPEAGVAYAYVTNRMGTRLSGDPRDVALREALNCGIAAASDDRWHRTLLERVRTSCRARRRRLRLARGPSARQAVDLNPVDHHRVALP